MPGLEVVAEGNDGMLAFEPYAQNDTSGADQYTIFTTDPDDGGTGGKGYNGFICWTWKGQPFNHYKISITEMQRWKTSTAKVTSYGTFIKET